MVVGKSILGGHRRGVLPYGGNFEAIGGFLVLAVTTLAEAVNQNLTVFVRQ